MISKTVIKLILIISLFSFGHIYSQEIYHGDPDVSFATARKLAFNEQRKQAQDTLQFILSKYPEYHDVRAFLASTYSWDGNYKGAKKEYDYILEKDQKNKTAWTGLIQNELWANTPFIALELSDKALTELPEDEDILLLKAQAQIRTNKQTEAIGTVKYILKKNPNNQKAKDFKNNLRKDLWLNTIGLIASTDFYSSNFDPMQYYSLKYFRQTKFGSITAKWNFNRRMDKNGQQIEFDVYPKITKGLYGYLNFAYSNSILFPKTKYGAELFKSFKKGMEASAGFRTLNYPSSTTMIYTGSLSWYTGNSYWSGRAYVTPGDSGTSLSGNLIYRKYLSDAYNYFGVAVGAGYSPEVNQLNYGVLEQQKFNLKSQKINFSYFFTSKNEKHAFGTQFGITHQEKQFAPGTYYWVYFLALSWDLRFR